jgi:hypothetical protein
MAGRKLPPELVQAVLGCLAAGMNPLRATVVSAGACGRLDRVAPGGVSRLAPRQAGTAARAAAAVVERSPTATPVYDLLTACLEHRFGSG